MKEKKFSPEDVVRLAVDIEKKGQAFYEELIESFDNPEIREIFQMMLNEEENHEYLFNDFLEKYTKDTVRKSFEEEGRGKIEALAASHLFVRNEKIEEKINQITSPIEAIELAIEFEKDSVVFFTGIKEYVFEDEYGVIEKLAKEEMLHDVRLLDMKKKYL